MAKKGTAHYSKKTPQLEHNDRTKDEAKTIHKELSHLNEYTCTSQEVQTKIDELYSKAQNNFYEYCKNKNGLAKEILDIALETQETALKLKNDLDLREIDLKLKENDLNAKETHLNEERQKIESGYPEAFNDLEKKRNQEKKAYGAILKISLQAENTFKA